MAPNKHLVKQVIAEAAQLGIAVTTDVDSSQYLLGEAIGVINAHDLVNGKTKFSERGPTRSRVRIGAVIIDDAHAAIATTRSQLARSLPHGSDGYRKLLDLFEDDLREQSVNRYVDVLEERRGIPTRVPFWTWRGRLGRVVPHPAPGSAMSRVGSSCPSKASADCPSSTSPACTSRKSQTIACRQAVTANWPSLPHRAGKAHAEFTKVIAQLEAPPPPKRTPGRRRTNKSYIIRTEGLVRPDVDFDKLARVLLAIARDQAEKKKAA